MALDYQRTHPEILIVVTADHGHTSQIVSEDASGSGQTLTLTYGTAGFGGAGAAPWTSSAPTTTPTCSAPSAANPRHLNHWRASWRRKW